MYPSYAFGSFFITPIVLAVEGAATGLLPELEKPEHMLHKLWKQILAAEVIEGVCRACANKMGTVDTAQSLGLDLLAEMSGHPAMASYREAGFDIITF